MSQVFEVHFRKGPGIELSALRGIGVWAEMIEFMRDRDPTLEQVTAYNWNLDKLPGWDVSQWGSTTSEPAMVLFRDKQACDAFAAEFAEHISSVRTAKGEDWAEDEDASDGEDDRDTAVVP